MNKETGWLIELQRDSESPQWLGVSPEKTMEFYTDSLKAVRFARQEDAKAMMKVYDYMAGFVRYQQGLTMWGKLIVTEHTWN